MKALNGKRYTLIILPMLITASLLIYSKRNGGENNKDVKEEKISRDEYTIKIILPEKSAEDEKNEVKIIITARAPYKVNTKFPFKIEASLSKNDEGKIKIEKNILKKSDATTMKSEKAEFSLAFTPTSAGKFNLHLKIRLSVCSKSKCIVKKEEKTVSLKVIEKQNKR